MSSTPSLVVIIIAPRVRVEYHHRSTDTSDYDFKKNMKVYQKSFMKLNRIADLVLNPAASPHFIKLLIVGYKEISLY